MMVTSSRGASKNETALGQAIRLDTAQRQRTAQVIKDDRIRPVHGQVIGNEIVKTGNGTHL